MASEPSSDTSAESLPLAWPTLLAFWRRYVVRYIPTYLLGLGFLGATNALTTYIPRLIQEAFDAIGQARGLDAIERTSLFLAGSAVTIIFVRTLSRVLFFNPGRTVEFRLKNDLFTRLLRLSPAFYRVHSVGDILSRATNDIMFVRAFVGFSLLQAANIVIAVALTLGNMVRIDAILTLYCLAPLVLAAGVLSFGIRRMFKQMKAAQETLGELSQRVLETYNGIAVVQGAAAEPAFMSRFDLLNERYARLHTEAALVRCFVLPAVTIVGSVCLFILLFVGGRHVAESTMTIGELAAYASYIGILVTALNSAGWVAGMVQRGLLSLQRVFSLLDTPRDTPEGADRAGLLAGPLQLEVRGLTHRFADARPEDPDALRDVSFTLAPGQTLGLFGAVGSGKSTLVALLGRLLRPSGGVILLNGCEIDRIDEAELRAAVAVVPQEAFLFSRPVRENVGFIDRPAEIDDSRVKSAVDRAALRADLERLPDGVLTVVGERGIMLSGGQRQRAAIARALYRPFRLLVLDDVLSAVDTETEVKLLAQIRDLAGVTGGHTTVLVSHRISTLAHADLILVLDDGRVVDRGTHAELAARPGLYAEIWTRQNEARALA